MRALRAAILAWSITTSAAAQDRPPLGREVTVDAVVRYARDRALRTRAARSDAATAAADVAAASVYPNPTVSYSVYGRARGQSDAINGTQHQLWLEQPVLLGHDTRRREAAEGVAEARRAAVEAAVFEVTLEARRRFVALLAAQEVVALLRATREELEGVAVIVRGRADAGALSAYDVARIELETAQLDATLASAEADARQRSSALAAWLGLPGWTPTARGSLPGDAATGPFERLWRLTLASSYELLAARRITAAAALDVRRAERERWPVPTLGLGAYVTTDGASSSVYGSLSLPLPLWDTGSAQVRRAVALQRAAEAHERAVEAELRARLEGALAVLDQRRAALDLHAARVGPALPRLREMAVASYRSGATRIFDLLDALRTRRAALEQRIELAAAVEEARVDVDAALGFAPP